MVGSKGAETSLFVTNSTSPEVFQFTGCTCSQINFLVSLEDHNVKTCISEISIVTRQFPTEMPEGSFASYV